MGLGESWDYCPVEERRCQVGSGSGRCCCLRAEHQPELLELERFGEEKAEISRAACWVRVCSGVHGLALSKVQRGQMVSTTAQGTVAGGCTGTSCLLAVGRRSSTRASWVL